MRRRSKRQRRRLETRTNSISRWCLGGWRRRERRRLDENYDARVGELPRSKTLQRPVVKRLWKGRASEDREEWMEEVKGHCERCHDDTDETSQMQEDRIQEQLQRKWSRGLDWKDDGDHCRQSSQGSWEYDEEQGQVVRVIAC